ncbi:hypothetical protein [Aliikangiella sp. IMCC44359]|uniref:hypothetical protein n=1 Tax=Aliikangiella sp. IMCC44359 TaxID=3459125 RepID=UPI00403AFF55
MGLKLFIFVFVFLGFGSQINSSTAAFSGHEENGHFWGFLIVSLLVGASIISNSVKVKTDGQSYFKGFGWINLGLYIAFSFVMIIASFLEF